MQNIPQGKVGKGRPDRSAFKTIIILIIIIIYEGLSVGIDSTCSAWTRERDRKQKQQWFSGTPQQILHSLFGTNMWTQHSVLPWRWYCHTTNEETWFISATRIVCNPFVLSMNDHLFICTWRSRIGNNNNNKCNDSASLHEVQQKKSWFTSSTFLSYKSLSDVQHINCIFSPLISFAGLPSSLVSTIVDPEPFYCSLYFMTSTTPIPPPRAHHKLSSMFRFPV